MTSKKLQAVLEALPKEGYVFDKENHLHILDGKALTGITTVLGVIAKPALIQWSADEAVKYLGWWNEKYEDKMEDLMAKWTDMRELKTSDFYKLLCEARLAHRKKKEKAGDWGTEVHAWIEQYIKGCMSGTPELNSVPLQEGTQRDACTNFMKWTHENKVKFIESERNLYSREWWTGGIADIVCEIDGKKFVGDVKTSSAIYPEMWIQGAAYAKMLKEMGLHDNIEGVVIINCKKDGGFQVETSYGLEDKIKSFEAALTLYRFAESYKNLA